MNLASFIMVSGFSSIRALLVLACFAIAMASLWGCRSLRVDQPGPLPEEPVPVPVDEVDKLERDELVSGIHYSAIQRGAGPPLSEEMHVSLHYTGLLSDEQTVFDSSYEREEPLRLILGREMLIPGLELALTQLNVGDRVRLWIPWQLAYGERGRGPIPGREDLVFDVEILDARPVESPTPFRVEGLDTLETCLGLQYILVSEGHGEPPMPGQVLVVHYTGYLSDGTLFDSSLQRNEPIRFILGAGQVLRGWEEAFALLNKGARARLILPPHLAYGDTGVGPIPPGETLVFDVELLDYTD